MKIFAFAPTHVNADEFIELWRARYNYRLDAKYEHWLTRPLTRDALQSLFIWKNGMKLSRDKQASIERHYLCRLNELNDLPSDLLPDSFLAMFGGGSTWRIFLLHCVAPKAYPIYDQHVHRAMTFMSRGVASEIPKKPSHVIDSYLTGYLPFHRQFSQFDQRHVDRALWAFGKFLKPPRWATGKS